MLIALAEYEQLNRAVHKWWQLVQVASALKQIAMSDVVSIQKSQEYLKLMVHMR